MRPWGDRSAPAADMSACTGLQHAASRPRAQAVSSQVLLHCRMLIALSIALDQTRFFWPPAQHLILNMSVCCCTVLSCNCAVSLLRWHTSRQAPAMCAACWQPAPSDPACQVCRCVLLCWVFQPAPQAASCSPATWAREAGAIPSAALPVFHAVKSRSAPGKA